MLQTNIFRSTERLFLSCKRKVTRHISKRDTIKYISANMLKINAFLLILSYYVVLSSAKEVQNLTIRGGLVHAPPMAIIDGDTYTGFQIDLLGRIKDLALQHDNINVTFDLEPAGSNYGKAFNYVANDCNTTSNQNLLQDCLKFDFIVGDFYTSPERYNRADFSPPWLPSRITTCKHNQKTGFDFNTLTESINLNAKVCVPVDTLIWKITEKKYPDLNIYGCPHQSACIEDLKAGNCVLYIEDELQLMYRATDDLSLTVTREQFFTQYIVWPISSSLDTQTTKLLKNWVYVTISEAIPDDLHEKYFEKGVCPAGTAGVNCEKSCHPVNGLSDKNGVCVCTSIRWKGEDCSIEKVEDKNLIANSLKIVGYVMFSINATTIFCCGIWLWFKRDVQKVKVAQPSFLALVLVGCLISTSTIISLGIESDGNGPVHACITIPWFYSIGFSVTFGTLFSKIRRIHLIFKSASACVRRTVKTSETLKFIGVVLAIDVIPLLVWTIVDPLTWKRTVVQEDQFGYPLSSSGFCTSVYWAYYTGIILFLHFMVMAIACYMCYVARSIPSSFSDAKYVTMAMFSNLQILVVGLPVLILVGKDPQTSYFVRILIVWINDFVVVALIFGNLIYQIYYGVDELQISQAVASFSQNVRRTQSVIPIRRKTVTQEFLTHQLNNSVLSQLSNSSVPTSFGDNSQGEKKASERNSSNKNHSNFSEYSSEYSSGPVKKEILEQLSEKSFETNTS